MNDMKKLDLKFTHITDETELNSINGGGSLKNLLEAAVKIIRSDDNEKKQV